MLRFLDIKYLMVVVAASLIGIVYIQISGVGPSLMANAPLVQYWNQHGQRADGAEAELARRNVEDATGDSFGGRPRYRRPTTTAARATGPRPAAHRPGESG